MRIKLLKPENDSVVQVLTEVQRRFITNKDRDAGGENELDWLNIQRGENDDHTFPQKVKFEFSGAGDFAEILLSEYEDFSEALSYSAKNGTAAIGNLKINQKYYWKVSAGGSTSEIFVFYTEDCLPRWIYVDGLSNVRDIGGWKTSDGRRVRQGLIYRGTELNLHHTITPAGIKTMREELKIRSDIDLREEAITRHITATPLGKDVVFQIYPIAAYGEFFELKGEEYCCSLFNVFADETYYPIYTHCWGGADRTGTLIFLLNAVLGVPFHDLVLDYELTTLSVWGERNSKKNYFQDFLKNLDRYGNEKESYNVKAYRYLTGVVGEKVIKRLRENLLEERRKTVDGPATVMTL